MTIAKILVPVTGSKRDSTALVAAFQAAKVFNAHVEVLFVHPDPREAIPYTEIPLTPEVVQDIVDTAEKQRDVASKAARQTLAAVAADMAVRVVEEPTKHEVGTASYRKIVGHLAGAVSEASILSDLVVFPPIAHSDNPEAHDAFVRVLTKSGRPVLLAPDGLPKHIGQKIAVGWDGRRAAANALMSALPFLDEAAAVEILSIQHVPTQDHSIDDVKEYLALHDISCVERIIEPGKRQIADVLLDAANGSGCDLLVVGGYGHSRLVESVFGGVTQSIVSHPTLPIFMVH